MKFGLAYCSYFATGEGHTVFIAIGNTKEAAETIFKKNVDEYFHRGMELTEGQGDLKTVVMPAWESDSASVGEYTMKYRRLLPKQLRHILQGGTTVHLEYFSRLHINAS